MWDFCVVSRDMRNNNKIYIRAAPLIAKRSRSQFKHQRDLISK